MASSCPSFVRECQNPIKKAACVGRRRHSISNKNGTFSPSLLTKNSCHRTLTPFAGVRIPHPLPQKAAFPGTVLSSVWEGCHFGNVHKAVTHWYPFPLPSCRCDVRYGSPEASPLHLQVVRWHPFRQLLIAPRAMAGWSRRQGSATKYFQCAMAAGIHNKIC